jgi:hypothetical protein
MIEIRVVENELGMKPDIEYRFVIFTANVTGALCPPNENSKWWSPWLTAPWVQAEGGNVDE